SSVGSFIMAIGVAVIILDVILHFRFGSRAARNPWNADTLEWATDLPPGAYNFISLPRVNGRHPLWDDPDLAVTIAAGEHALSDIGHGRRDIAGTDPVTAKMRQIVHLPTNSWLPLQVAATL